MVICTRNRADKIATAINSVLRNTYAAFDLTVVDQSTTDDTQAIVSEIADHDSRVRFVRDQGAGLSRAYNIGISASDGELLAFTDDDCVAPADWISSIVAAFATECDADLLYGQVLAAAATGATGLTPTLTIPLPERLSRRDGFRVFGMGANFAARRRLFRTVGLFDEVLGGGAALRSSQDFDLAYRTYRAGLVTMLRPEVTVVHDGYREPEEVPMLLRSYGVGDGGFYAKHVRCGDVLALRLLLARMVRKAAKLAVRRTLRLKADEGFYLRGVIEGIRRSLRYEVDRGARRYRLPGLPAQPAQPGAPFASGRSPARGGDETGGGGTLGPRLRAHRHRPGPQRVRGVGPGDLSAEGRCDPGSSRGNPGTTEAPSLVPGTRASTAPLSLLAPPVGMYQPPPYSATRSEVDDDFAASNGESNAPAGARALGPGRQAWLNGLAASAIFTCRVRRALLRVAGIDIGAAGVLPHVTFVSGHDVKICDQAFVSTGVVFDAGARIELGPRVSVGPRAQFLTSTHDLGPSTWRAGHNRYAPIRIEEGTWIGAGAVILAGVTIGAGCVIAAGAVVTHDCERDGLYAGVPALRKRDLPPPGSMEQVWRPRTAGPHSP